MGYPVDTSVSYLIEPFGTTTGRKFPHSGDDWTPIIKGRPSPSVMAVFDGEVIVSTSNSSAGNYVVLAANDGGFWVYAHLASRYVNAGDRVNEGQGLGLMGSTGNSSGIHLHLSRYTDRNWAVKALVATWVKGQTVDQWAAASRLSRPSNFYRVKDSGTSTPSTPAPIPEKEYEMTQAETDLILRTLGEIQVSQYDLKQRVARIEADGAINKWALTDPSAGVRKMVADVQVGLSQLPQTNVTPANLSLDEKTIDTIAKKTAEATLDGTADRLRD